MREYPEPLNTECCSSPNASTGSRAACSRAADTGPAQQGIGGALPSVVAPRSVAASGSSACTSAGDRKPSTLPPVGGPSTRGFFRAACDAKQAATIINLSTFYKYQCCTWLYARAGPCKRATALPSEHACILLALSHTTPLLPARAGARAPGRGVPRRRPRRRRRRSRRGRPSRSRRAPPRLPGSFSAGRCSSLRAAGARASAPEDHSVRARALARESKPCG